MTTTVLPDFKLVALRKHHLHFSHLSSPMYRFALIFGFVVAMDKRQSTPGWLKKPLQRESLPGKAGEALHSQTPAASEQPVSSLPATEQQGGKERSAVGQAASWVLQP